MNTTTTLAAVCLVGSAACHYEHHYVDCAEVCTGANAAAECPVGCAFGLDDQAPLEPSDPGEPEQPEPPEAPEPPAPGRAYLLGPVRLELACEAPAPEAALYVALSDACGDWSSVTQLQVWPLPDVDTAIYWFDVPGQADYALQAFVDCDGDAARSETPMPSAADRHFQVSADDGTPQPCRWYRLGGGDYYLELPITINAACDAAP